MPTYQQANADATKLLEGVRDEFHNDLVRAEVTVGLLFAHGARNEDGRITSPAIVKSGVKCAGLAKITGLRDRALGVPDAIILVDGDRWPEWDEARRRALLDHELQHLEIQREADSMFPVADDLGRPKLKIRPHDFEVGWFAVIARRHGPASFEVEQAKTLTDGGDQLVFPWAPDAPADIRDESTPSDRLAQDVVDALTPGIASDAWKAVPLAELEGIPGGTLELLETGHEPPILTIGDFQAWQATHAPKIKGLGQVKVDRVADAVADYFKAHPEFCGTAGPLGPDPSAEAVKALVSTGYNEDAAREAVAEVTKGGAVFSSYLDIVEAATHELDPEGDGEEAEDEPSDD